MNTGTIVFGSGGGSTPNPAMTSVEICAKRFIGVGAGVPLADCPMVFEPSGEVFVLSELLLNGKKLPKMLFEEAEPFPVEELLSEETKSQTPKERSMTIMMMSMVFRDIDI